MLPVIEKLKDLMNNFTSKVKSIYDSNKVQGDIYTKDYITKKIAAEVQTIRNSSLSSALALREEFKTAREDTRKQVVEVRYPNLSKDALRGAGELQLADARRVLEKADFNKTILVLEEAVDLNRTDFASYIFDNLKKEDVFLTDQKLIDLERLFNERIGALTLIQNYQQLDENKKLCDVFIEELYANGEYTPYPIDINSEDMTDEQYFSNSELITKSSFYWQKMSA